MSNLANILTIAGNATGTNPGIIILTKDLGGTYDQPTVLGLNGIPLAGTPAAGQVLTYNGTNWSPITPAGASATAKRVTSPSFTASMAPNASTTDILRITLTANLTLLFPTGTSTDGQVIQVHYTQDATGNRTVTHGTGYSASTDIPFPTLSTAGGATDIAAYEYSLAANKYRLIGVIKGF